MDLSCPGFGTTPRTGCERTAGRHQVVHEEHGNPAQIAPKSKCPSGKDLTAGPIQSLECGPGPPPAAQKRADRDPRGSGQRPGDFQARRESTDAGIPRVRGNGEDTTGAIRQLAEHGNQHPPHRIEKLLVPAEFRPQKIAPRQSGVAHGRCDRDPGREHRSHFERRVQAHPTAMAGPQGLGRAQSIPACEANRGQRGIQEQPGQRIAAQTMRSDDVGQAGVQRSSEAGTGVNCASCRSEPGRGRVRRAGSPLGSSLRRCSTRRTPGSGRSRPSGFRRTGGSRTPTERDPSP